MKLISKIQINNSTGKPELCVLNIDNSTSFYGYYIVSYSDLSQLQQLNLMFNDDLEQSETCQKIISHIQQFEDQFQADSEEDTFQATIDEFVVSTSLISTYNDELMTEAYAFDPDKHFKIYLS